MHSTCAIDEEPNVHDLRIAYYFGTDDGDWCRINDHEATVPEHYIHPKVIDACRKGYESTRNLPTK